VYSENYSNSFCKGKLNQVISESLDMVVTHVETGDKNISVDDLPDKVALHL